jgi:bacillithiol biosynthesis cysteine-adding enzyme BshC
MNRPLPVPTSLRPLSHEVCKYLAAGNPSVTVPDDALFVVTGQQPGVFGGPLLTLYKALSAIKVAGEYSTKLGRSVLPVFWIQSEDHDLREATALTVHSPAQGLSRFTVGDFGENRRSIGIVSFELGRELEALEIQLADSRFAGETTSLLKRCYTKRPLNQSFRELYQTLLPGLLFIDPFEDSFRSLCAPIWQQVMKTSLLKRQEIERALLASPVTTVKVKQASPLFFLADSQGNRFRLEEKVDHFTFNGTSLTEGELLNFIDSAPFSLSTSALLRPIMQDALLPTLAYIGGDTELSYHRQLDEVYPLFGLIPPALLPRAKYRFMERRAAQWLDGLTGGDLLLSDSELLTKLRQLGKISVVTGAELTEAVRPLLDSVVAKLEKVSLGVDKTLEKPLRKTKENLNFSVSQFISRYERSLLQREEVTVSRLSRLRDLLFPLGKEQERILSLPSLLCRVGVEGVSRLESTDLKLEEL